MAHAPQVAVDVVIFTIDAAEWGVDTAGREAVAARMRDSTRFVLELLEGRPDLVRAVMQWFPVRALPSLAYDHNAITRYALTRLQSKLEYTNIVYSLLPRDFTLGELQEVYEIILGRGLDRRNFRKKILALGLLRPLHRQRRGAHRPAQLYAFTRRAPMNIEML